MRACIDIDVKRMHAKRFILVGVQRMHVRRFALVGMRASTLM
jgi:hypothetical protein